MLTIENLKALGADTDDGIRRCLGKEDFYLRMVSMALSNDSFEKLRSAVESGDLKEGFERAHALKGALSNVSLTSLLEPVVEITEELRAHNEIDYSDLLDRIDEQLAKYKALM